MRFCRHFLVNQDAAVCTNDPIFYGSSANINAYVFFHRRTCAFVSYLILKIAFFIVSGSLTCNAV